jgi:asparagine synthase (glutamine-hydrolysing)
LLSGGLDSSLISAIAAKNSKIKTFSVGFPSSYAHDETEYARYVARHIGSDHHELMIDEVQPETLQTLAFHFDEPIIDSSMIPTFLISKMVRKHCKVVLGGDGADELFGGYPHYNKWFSISSLANKIPFVFRKIIALSSKNLLPLGFFGKNYLSSLDIDLNSELPRIAEFFDAKTIQLLFSSMTDETKLNIVNNDCWRELVYKHSNLVHRFSYTDFRNYLTEDILVKVDRASMANSLEVRSPFLDKTLINFALARVPSCYKFDGKNRKILLSQLAKQYLPKDFDLIRKQGFTIPKNLIFENDKVLTFILDTLSSQNSIYEKSIINPMINKEKNRKGGMERIFTLCQLDLWAGQHGINF